VLCRTVWKRDQLEWRETVRLYTTHFCCFQQSATSKLVSQIDWTLCPAVQLLQSQLHWQYRIFVSTWNLGKWKDRGSAWFAKDFVYVTPTLPPHFLFFAISYPQDIVSGFSSSCRGDCWKLILIFDRRLTRQEIYEMWADDPWGTTERGNFLTSWRTLFHATGHWSAENCGAKDGQINQAAEGENYLWRVLSSGMLRHAVYWKFTDDPCVLNAPYIEYSSISLP
jgi:hypothetical protein